MNRAEKAAAIEELSKKFQENPHLVLASFDGLTVNQANELRRKIDSAGGSYRVIKNRLAKRAAAGTPVEPMAEQFKGTCAVATHASDPVVLAKALAEFAMDNPQLELRSGLIDAKSVVDADGIKQLSSLPGLPELRAQLLSLINTPATTLVRLLGTPGTQLAQVLKSRGEKLESEG